MKKRRPHRLSKRRKGPHWYTAREIERDDLCCNACVRARNVERVVLVSFRANVGGWLTVWGA